MNFFHTTTRQWLLFAGLILLTGLILLFGWDYPISRAMTPYGRHGLGWLWKETAYYAGLGGVQIGLLLALALHGFWRRDADHLRWGLAGAAITGSTSRLTVSSASLPCA